ncbi:FadR/GntR family transcriptional regulator [Kineosporia sp. A_224]|uniref:FadR/GntR family transcriptional regulator n=1 Tax=Kineosporia sp. A_224 TaxID=1962180 RepID=UPI000B4BDDCA|nr:FadR/GntR family transcriptional regulator [Kineosporia sp. A_224]
MPNHDSMWMPFAQELIVRIVSGRYPAGSLIPTETQLGEEFGVSRTVVREGTKVLADKGLLLSRRGLGTRVLDPSEWRTFDPDVLAARLEHGDRSTVLREVLVLRRSIEPELAARAAELAEDDELADLTQFMSTLAAAQRDTKAYMRLDAEFHARVAELGRNSLLRDVTRFLEHPVAIQRELTGKIPGASTKETHRQHNAVFLAIVDRDPERARVAMLDHIRWAEDRLDRVLTASNGTGTGASKRRRAR